MKLVRLINVCLHKIYSKVQTYKLLSVKFPIYIMHWNKMFYRHTLQTLL